MPNYFLLICASTLCLSYGFSLNNKADLIKRADLDMDGKLSSKEIHIHIENFFYGSQNFTAEEIDQLIDVYFE